MPSGSLTVDFTEPSGCLSWRTWLWKIEADKFLAKITIPPNTTAEVTLPGKGGTSTLASGTYQLTSDL